MKLEVNLSKKYFFILLGAILILAGAIYANAYNSGMPANILGHSGEEIDVIVNNETISLNEALENLASSSSFPDNCQSYDVPADITGNEFCKNLGGFCGGMWFWSAPEWVPRGCDTFGRNDGNGHADCCIPDA